MSNDLLPPVAEAVNELFGLADLGWDASPDDVCDALWLARHVPARIETFSAGWPSTQPTPASAPPLTAAVETGPPPEPVDSSVDLVFPRNRSGRGTLHRAGRPVTLPAARPLTDSLAIGRAMRPLRIRRPSRFRHTVDEVATANQAARSGVWQPILRPRQERWPDAALVIDGTATTALWREEFQGLHALLGQLGAFRQLRSWRLTLDEGNRPRISTQLVPRPERPDRGSDPVATLNDPAGRRLIVVVTDGVHRAWGDGTYREMLTRLGAANPVIVISVLPHWLWPPTGLRARPGRVRVTVPIQPNARWRYRPVTDMASSPADSCPIPVLDLSPQRFGKGVQMLAGGAAWTRMRLLDDSPAPYPPEPDDVPESDGLAGYFTSRLSPAAFQLLQALACVPDFLMMEAIRALQHQLLPESGVAELAEVLLCGAFQPPEQALSETGDLFRFRRPEDAAALAAACSPAYSSAVLRILGEQLADAPGAVRGIMAGGVEDPHSELLSAADVTPSRVPARLGATPRQPGPHKLIVRDIVCHLAAQSRARAAEILAGQGVEAGVLRLLDAAVVGAQADEGVSRLEAVRSAGDPALHLDNADRLTDLSRLRLAVLAMVSASATGDGPQLIVLSRRPRTTPGFGRLRTFAEVLPRHFDAFLGNGPQVSYSYAREYQELIEENAPVRFFRHTVARLGRVPTDFEDRLWQQLNRSEELGGVPRRHFLDLANALAADIGRRRRKRLGPYRGGPAETADLPDDIDTFLRSKL